MEYLSQGVIDRANERAQGLREWPAAGAGRAARGGPVVEKGGAGDALSARGAT
jgi:hypothetical protein